MDVIKMREEGIKKKKEFISGIKKRCEFILFDFQKPKKKAKYKQTEYVWYPCKLIKVNGITSDYGKHVIQIPFKTAWLQLYDYLEKMEALNKKDIHLFVVKRTNYHYIWNSPSLEKQHT